MEYRRLGSSGVNISAISLGAWLTYGSNTVEDDMSVQCLRTAIENGVNFIDVADMYSDGEAEKVVGKVLKDYDRSKLVISTKAFWPMSDDVNDRGLSRKHIFESVHKSLKRFDVDYIDVFFCHRYDEETPTEETVRTINDLMQQGKILYWGTSMWSPAALNEAVDVANKVNAYKPVTEQPLYNMLDREHAEGEMEYVCKQHGIGLVVWSPLAGGVLTGKYNDGIPEGSSRATSYDWFQEELRSGRIEKARKISALAAEMGITPASLALAWALKNPVVSSVITGATKPAQVLENLKALDVEVTDEINEKIEEILDNKPEFGRRNGR